MDVVDRVRLSGPLAPHARGFAGELSRLGFTRCSSQKQLQLAAHVSRWLDDAGLGAADLDAGAVDGFLEVRGGSVIRAVTGQPPRHVMTAPLQKRTRITGCSSMP